MSQMFYKIIIAIILITMPLSVSSAQSFGFGCLGLSGFYGGYTQQYYKADGINDYVRLNYSQNATPNNIKFHQGTGFRIGANLFRADFDDVFLTIKGYFQFLKEEHDVDDPLTQGNTQGVLHKKFQLTMNHWGVALDFGFPLFSIIDFKLIEGGITFYNSEFAYNSTLNNLVQTDIKMSPDNVQLGYYVGSGLIINLIRDYISLEGTAAYTLLKIDKMNDSNGSIVPPVSSNNRAIENGGFSATVQLNVGFPL